MGEPEEIVVLDGSDWRMLLIEYANRAAKAMGRGRRAMPRMSWATLHGITIMPVLRKKISARTLRR